eukprot:Platyproteum_vivax@DN2125_c0_g1_i1.p1
MGGYLRSPAPTTPRSSICGLPERIYAVVVLMAGCKIEGSAGGMRCGKMVMMTDQLEELRIGKNAIGNHGVLTLAETVSAKALRGLKRVDCQSCGVEGKWGAEALQKLIMKSAVLEDVHLNKSNRMNDECTRSLRDCAAAEKVKNLKHLQ